MGERYAQLSLEDRCEIVRLQANGCSIRQIAAALDRAPSTISREMKRNHGRQLGYWLDLLWSKRRIIEVYLNVAEFGPGIYGAQAAARHHFGKNAKALTAREAALLAAVLPNPVARSAGRPGPLTRWLAVRAEQRGRLAGAYIDCIR